MKVILYARCIRPLLRMIVFTCMATVVVAQDVDTARASIWRSEMPGYTVGVVLGQHNGVVAGVQIWRYGGLELFAGTSDLARREYRYSYYALADYPYTTLQLLYVYYSESQEKHGVRLRGGLSGGGLLYQGPEGRVRKGLVGSAIVCFEAAGLPVLFRFQVSIAGVLPYGGSYGGGGYTLGLLYRFE